MEVNKKISGLLCCLREKNPLIHQITNYVTVNDCANITLAIGASPVMADDINEVEEMAALASALVINIGTLNSKSVESMIAAGKKANELGVPVILDPVGAGATSYRTETALRIINEVKLSVIRGNISEIKALSGLAGETKGVDAAEDLSTNSREFARAKYVAIEFAEKLHTVIAITGAVDIITDGRVMYTVENGHKIMSRVTGTGCMCSALIGAFLGVTKNHVLATIAGIVSMGIAGELASETLEKSEGTGSLKVKIIDTIYNLCEEHYLKRGKVYETECML